MSKDSDSHRRNLHPMSDTLHRMDGGAASERDRLPVQGFSGTPEEIERQWYEHVYRGRGDRMRQLTWRAVIMGSLLGGVLSLTNLYIGLKAGWGFGVAITACILSYAIWTTLHRPGIRRFTIDGVLLPCVGNPFPSCPVSLAPQHAMVPLNRTAQVCREPALMATNPPKTVTGTGTRSRTDALPSPS